MVQQFTTAAIGVDDDDFDDEVVFIDEIDEIALEVEYDDEEDDLDGDDLEDDDVAADEVVADSDGDAEASEAPIEEPAEEKE